jgi:hypothetical protein
MTPHGGTGGHEMCTVIPTTFVFSGGNAPQARRVALIGPLNGWNAASHPLTKTSGGDWTITVYLPAGRIVYGFDVDGAFWLDPCDEGRLPNGRGSEYSIRFVRPSADTTPIRGAAGVRAPRPHWAFVRATQARAAADA